MSFDTLVQTGLTGTLLVPNSEIFNWPVFGTQSASESKAAGGRSTFLSTSIADIKLGRGGKPLEVSRRRAPSQGPD